jgi:hypothetical protein
VKLFVDSADPAEIGACVAAERTSGVTTSGAALAAAAPPAVLRDFDAESTRQADQGTPERG